MTPENINVLIAAVVFVIIAGLVAWLISKDKL